jgi:hypothetical protein
MYLLHMGNLVVSMKGADFLHQVQPSAERHYVC